MSMRNGYTQDGFRTAHCFLLGGGRNSERISIMALSTTKSTGGQRSQTTPLPKQQGRRWSRYSNRTFYLFVSPWILGFLLLTLIPLLYALGLSFTDWDG